MGFLCPRVQQIHSTILEYFCSNTPVTFFKRSSVVLVVDEDGGGWEEEGKREKMGSNSVSELLHVTCDLFPELSVIL